jgi:hypothetical protein
MPLLLTPTERVTLEMIRDTGTALETGLALALRKGWASSKGGRRAKGSNGGKGPYRLTDAGQAALDSDDEARLASLARQ